MKSVAILRLPSREWGTLGRLVDRETGFPLCDTLELPWRDNAIGRSCIPSGEYTVTLSKSPKFGRMLYLVEGTAPRSGIRFHSGNIIQQIDGCILPGIFSPLVNITYKGVSYSQPGVTDSARTLSQLMAHLGQRFNLSIINQEL